jgi:hypothetical protein
MHDLSLRRLIVALSLSWRVTPSTHWIPVPTPAGVFERVNYL